MYPPVSEKSSNRRFALEALEVRYAVCEKLHKKPDAHESIVPGLISDFRVFWWMVKPEWNVLIDACNTLIKQRNGVGKELVEEEDGGAAASSSSSSADPVVKKAKTKAAEKKADVVMAGVMGKFGSF